ncbi:MAG: ATP-binding cassette domain-containing protein, partial [Bacteroidales bacterium]|nr:ATP-binding cassette domain-containing protein [Bacteroidales bacterium]
MLKLNNICKNLGEFNLSNLNLKVKKGEYFMILGKSGAGKSLFLELITGMQNPDKGEIILDGINITHKKIQKRQVGMVFQDYAIFPHLSVY